MIVDTSALIAILANEPERPAFVQAVVSTDAALISAANHLETALVIDGYRDPVLSRRLDELMEELRIEVTAITREHLQIARDAYRDFGRGSGHPARLNFGDCFSYAVARSTGQALLFKGDDFIHTDLRPAV
jgi:ribonuclease VapC